MNKTFNFFAIIISIMWFPIFAYANDDWAQLDIYAEANLQIMSQPDSLHNRVVLIGNSITEGWAKADPEFFSKNNFVGRGISGQTTYQMLLRFREDVIDLIPEIVVINGGINDIAENNYSYDEDRTFGNLVSMAQLAEANGINVIMTSVLPADKIPWRKSISNVPGKVKSLNDRIREYADDKGFPYIDYYALMVSEGGALNPEYTKDGVHPTLEGYKTMEHIALPVIREAKE